MSSGGSMVAPELVRNIRQAFDCDFGTLYGQTEASPVITQHHHDDSLDDICNTIGQPVPQTAVSIRSVDENKVVPLDTVGMSRNEEAMLDFSAEPITTRMK